MSDGPDTVFPVGREGKPREKVLTLVNDRLRPIDKDLLGPTAQYIDYVKIGLSPPILLEKTTLVERIRRYHDAGIKVQSGGTLVQVAYRKRIVSQVFEKLRAMGFDAIEISESAIDIPREVKEDIINSIKRLSMEYFFEVGKKDTGHQVPVSYLISKIQEAIDLKSPKILIEGGLGKGIGIYDSEGEIIWDSLNEIVGRFGPPNLVFEAPLETQRTALILEFGPNVNLASVSLEDVLPLEMQRQGLTTETLGVAPPVQNVQGSPAMKFVYHLIKTEHPIDQTTLIQRSGLPKRTLQAALSSLVETGLVREIADMSDLRRHKYTPR